VSELVARPLPDGLRGDLATARDGDGEAFDRLVAPLRRELHAHCYRMLGSTHDADDALQEALLRAWRGLRGFRGSGSFRGWLYTVATRTCLDAIAQRDRRALPVDLGPASERAVVDDARRTEVPWLEPYPDAGLAAERRESVELAFVAACQHLPGNQRAALLLFDVLGFSAAEIAGVMGTSVASVNSALQRARRIVAEKVPAASRQRAPRLGDARLRDLAAGFAGALERGDADALVELLTADVTWSMPPYPHWYAGLAAVRDFAERVPMTRCGDWRHTLTTANGWPARASYLRPAGASGFTAWSVDVLAVRGDRIAAITSFVGADFAAFGLPPRLG
jgi:RNA polymerase sigma-70 factor, ECF subfamily